MKINIVMITIIITVRIVEIIGAEVVMVMTTKTDNNDNNNSMKTITKIIMTIIMIMILILIPLICYYHTRIPFIAVIVRGDCSVSGSPDIRSNCVVWQFVNAWQKIKEISFVMKLNNVLKRSKYFFLSLVNMNAKQ